MVYFHFGGTTRQILNTESSTRPTCVRDLDASYVACVVCMQVTRNINPLTSKYAQYKHNLRRYSLLHMHAHTHAHTRAHTHAHTHTHVCLYVDTRTLAVPPTHKFFAIFVYGLPDQAKGTLNVWTRTHSTTHTRGRGHTQLKYIHTGRHTQGETLAMLLHRSTSPAYAAHSFPPHLANDLPNSVLVDGQVILWWRRGTSTSGVTSDRSPQAHTYYNGGDTSDKCTGHES